MKSEIPTFEPPRSSLEFINMSLDRLDQIFNSVASHLDIELYIGLFRPASPRPPKLIDSIGPYPHKAVSLATIKTDIDKRIGPARSSIQVPERRLYRLPRTKDGDRPTRLRLWASPDGAHRLTEETRRYSASGLPGLLYELDNEQLFRIEPQQLGWRALELRRFTGLTGYCRSRRSALLGALESTIALYSSHHTKLALSAILSDFDTADDLNLLDLGTPGTTPLEHEKPLRCLIDLHRTDFLPSLYAVLKPKGDGIPIGTLQAVDTQITLTGKDGATRSEAPTIALWHEILYYLATEGRISFAAHPISQFSAHFMKLD